MLLKYKSDKIYVLCLLILFAIFCSCSAKPSKIIADDDNGSKIEINNGEILGVKLNAQLGTGFGWKVIEESKGLKQMGEPEQFSKDENKTGGIDCQTFKFKAIKKGETELKLQYIEIWKEGAKPVKDYNVIVIIK